jgi:pentatricopeptide repeat protein
MNLYARAHDPEMCEKLVLEAKDLGMVVDTPTYTTLINAYFKNKNLKKCWEHYYESVVIFYLLNLFKASNPEISTDEVLTGLMIEICAHSNDAERAISLYENMEARGFH